MDFTDCVQMHIPILEGDKACMICEEQVFVALAGSLSVLQACGLHDCTAFTLFAHEETAVDEVTCVQTLPVADWAVLSPAQAQCGIHWCATVAARQTRRAYCQHDSSLSGEGCS